MVRILTDSTADLGDAAADLGVDVIPLRVDFGDAQYEDGIDLAPETFYEMLAAAPKLPKTSQPSPDKFLSYFLEAQAAGDSVVCILISSALSGTFQSAQIAREEAAYDGVWLVDSKNATLALGLLVHRAAALRDKGLSASAIAAQLELAKEHLHLCAVVDDLSYLRKGGRLSTAAAVAGGLLGIKPVVAINTEGKLGLAGKARGMPGAYVTIFKLIETYGGIDETWPVIVGYTGKRAGVEPFAHYVTEKLHMQKPLLFAIGSVIGTHAGPGACGIAFFDKSPE